MTGTTINVIAVVLGGTLGAVMGDRLPDRFRQIIMQALSLVVLALAIDMSLQTNQILVVLGAILMGVLLGEWWDLDKRLNQVGVWLESRARRYPILTRGNFTRGFVASSLIICVGPLAILGAIQDGLSGDYTLLAIKSTMDFFVTMALGAAFGMGVAFSALSILIVQGGITLSASLVESLMTETMIAELSATGGVMLLGLGISMLEIKRIKVANFLPALLFVPIFVLIWQALGI
jgi:uncharacterized membrane protein YqgA involved in biofilm formation